MTRQPPTTATLVAAVCGIASLATEAYAMRRITLEGLILYAWVAAPFAVLVALNVRTERHPSARLARKAAAAGAWIVAPLSTFVYFDAVFRSRSSTGGLVFLFLPLWTLLLIAVAVFVVSVLAPRRDAHG